MKTIFFLCDTLRYDRVTPSIMPRLSGFAEKGVKYAMYWGPGGTTKDALPYILCGENTYSKSTSFPSKLEAAGIKTLIVHSNALIAAQKYQECFGEWCDVDMKHAQVTSKAHRELKKLGLWEKTRGLRTALRGGAAAPPAYRRAEVILEDAQSYLDENARDFTWIHLMDPHIPYLPPELSKVEMLEARKLNNRILENIGKPLELTPLENQRITRLYDMECSYMDRCIGDFVDANPEYLYMFTADHGDMFGENYTYSHSPGPHGVTPQLGHLPFIVYGPGIPAKTITRYNCSVNIGATVLDLYGLPPRLGYGRSFKEDFVKPT